VKFVTDRSKARVNLTNIVRSVFIGALMINFSCTNFPIHKLRYLFASKFCWVHTMSYAIKLRCDTGFQCAFTLVWAKQRNYFENATACSKRTQKTTVATQLNKRSLASKKPPFASSLELQLLKKMLVNLTTINCIGGYGPQYCCINRHKQKTKNNYFRKKVQKKYFFNLNKK